MEATENPSTENPPTTKAEWIAACGSQRITPADVAATVRRLTGQSPAR